MTRLVIKILAAIMLISLCRIPAYAVPAPHNEPISCLQCHVSHDKLGAQPNSNLCLTCHNPFGMAQRVPFTPGDAADPYGSEQPSPSVVQSSHNWAGSDTRPEAGALPPARPGLVYPMFTGIMTCAKCHNLHGPRSSATNSAPFLRDLNDRDQMCLDCHRPRNKQSHIGGTHPVAIDYDSVKSYPNYTTVYYTTPQTANPANPSASVKLVGGQVVCSTCHRVHYTDSDSATFDNRTSALLGQLTPSAGYLLRTDYRGKTAAAANICMNCHKGKVAHNGAGQNVQCTDCHAGHVDYDPQAVTDRERIANVDLVRRYMNVSTSAGKVAGRVFYQYTGVVRNYKDASNTGVCQGCHAVPPAGYSAIKNQTYPAEHDSMSADVCVTCHAHGNSKGSFSGSCYSCHGYPPPNAAAGYTAVDEASSPHQKHAGNSSTYSFSCNECHKGNAHNNGGYQDVFIDKTGILAGAAATYTKETRTCTTLYCHSDGTSVATGQAAGGSVIWGPDKLGCNGCHGTPPAYASGTPKANSHPQHAAFGCTKCHAGTTADGSTITTAANHLNKSYDLAAGPGVSFNYSYLATGGSCSTISCHGNSGATWGGTLSCDSCHGNPPPAAAAGYGGDESTSPHRKHAGQGANYSYACSQCHKGNAHGNGTFQDVFRDPSGILAGSNAAYDPGTRTCTSVYCHSNGAGGAPNIVPIWGGGTLDCTGCHGDATTLASNAHQKHVNALLGKGYACVTCHASTVSGSTTIVNKNLHGDGSVEIAGALTFTSGTKTCATACHGNAAPAWNSIASGGCGTCHKALSTTIGGVIDTNAHITHFLAAYGPHYDPAGTNSCAVCHIYTTDTAATHVNGIFDLAAGFSKNGTCATCHQQTTSWTGGRVSCESCHTATSGPLSVIGGIPAPDKTLAATAGHGKSGIGQACTNCHDNTGNHIGVAGGTKRLLSGLTGATNAECNFCHQNPATVTPQHLNMQVHVSFANTCVVCHDPHGTSNSKMVLTNFTTNRTTAVSFGGTDFVNPQGTGVCQTCHTGTAYYKKNVAEANHPDAGCLDCHAHNAKSGTAFEPNRACDSCHGYPPAPRVVTSAITFGIQGSWSSARFEDYSGGGGAHLVAQHVAANVRPSDEWAPCLPCHNGGAASHKKVIPARGHVENTTVQVDPQYRFSTDYFISYTGAKYASGGTNKTGSCFNVSCHMGPTPKWSIER